MEVAYCGACEHPSPIHVGARGRCRLNGCPCQGFVTAPATSAPMIAELEPAQSGRGLAALILPPAIAFIAGVVLGAAGQ